MYQIVLIEGTADDLSHYIDGDELVRLWPQLWLPAHVRDAWRSRIGATAR